MRYFNFNFYCIDLQLGTESHRISALQQTDFASSEEITAFPSVIIHAGRITISVNDSRWTMGKKKWALMPFLALSRPVFL